MNGEPQKPGTEAAGNTNAPHPKKTWRRRLRNLAVFIVGFLLALTLFDVLVWKGAGVQSVMYWHGRRVCSVEDVRYELSGDRSEIVMTCDLQTRCFDEFPPVYFRDIRPGYLDHYSVTGEHGYLVGRPNPSRILHEKHEKRIPVASVRDRVADALIGIELERSSGHGALPDFTKYLDVADSYEKSRLGSWDTVWTRMPFFRNSLELAPEQPAGHDSSALSGDLPGGRKYRMIMDQWDLDLLKDCVICGLPEYPHRLVMVPYDRPAALSGGESIRCLLIPQNDEIGELFYGDVLKEMDAMEPVKKRFLPFCVKILCLPAGAIMDVSLFFRDVADFIRHPPWELPNPH